HVDVDPDLGIVPRSRRPFLQADAARGHQRYAINPFFFYFNNDRRRPLAPARTFFPSTAVMGIPQIDHRDSRRSDVFDFVVEDNALAVDGADRNFPPRGRIAYVRWFLGSAVRWIARANERVRLARKICF